MSTSELLTRAYPELTPKQAEELLHFENLLQDWNQRINLVSRKEERILERHIIPSLFPLKFLSPPSEGRVLDIGTGGGLPGIPLAILYPQLHFTLLDSTRKKLKAVEAMAGDLSLSNVETRHERAEELRFQADLITGRAVTALPRFVSWSRKKLGKDPPRDGADRGILYWTGGEKEEELKGIDGTLEIHRMREHLNDPELESKMVVRISFPSP